MRVSGGISANSDSSNSGTEGFDAVSTELVQPNSGRYFTNFVVRCTPAPPTGGKAYETKSTRRMDFLDRKRTRKHIAARRR
jgi:hypothetical protein